MEHRLPQLSFDPRFARAHFHLLVRWRMQRQSGVGLGVSPDVEKPAGNQLFQLVAG
jgi:hypothetical protein